MSDSDECYTPREWIVRVRAVLGTIDLDPASCEAANEVVRAKRFYKFQGLRRRWKGRVFLNPPYSDPGPWVHELIKQYDARDVPEAITLLNSRSSSRWFKALAVRFWRCEPDQRIRFYGPATTPGQTGRLDQVFFYLGTNLELFRATFGDGGRLTPPSVTLAVTRACAVCTRPLNGRRADSETCGDACRQRLCRSRRSTHGGAS